jgi:hypothetical protein
MLLKAAILHRGGRIREKRARGTIGFDACMQRSLSDGKIRYLTGGQALVLQTINGLRDAAQHHLLDISEGQLYVHLQSGVTLFRDILEYVFGQDLATHLPSRVLPVSTSPPTELATLFDSEVSEIRKLLRLGRRRRLEALARLRPLAILDGTFRGEKGQPRDSDLSRLGNSLLAGKKWGDVFPGVAAVEMKVDGTVPSLSLRLSKKEGIPIQIVAEGTPGASVVAVKSVSELGFYNLGAVQLAKKVGLTMPNTLAVLTYPGLQNDPKYYKKIRIGGSEFKRYSPMAIDSIKEALTSKSADEIWKRRSMKTKGAKR